MSQTQTVISIQNRKGGVGKTTTTFQLGGALSLLDKRVLLIDTDPQASLTTGFLGASIAGAVPPARSSLAIANGREPDPATLILPTAFEGLDLIPSVDAAKLHNAPDAMACSIDDRCRMRDFCEELEGYAYDLVLIDGPPNLQLFSWQNFSAADWVLIPTQPEDFGAQGLSAVLDFAEAVKGKGGEEGNAALRWLGCLVNLVDKRSAIHRECIEQMEEVYPGAILDTRITRLNAVIESIMLRTPVSILRAEAEKPTNAVKVAASLYDALAAEVLQRIENASVGQFPARMGVAG